MKFQLTCFVDETLIGPLTELIAPYSRVIVKLAEGEKPPEDKPRAALLTRRRTSSFLQPARGGGPLAVLRALVDGKHTVKEVKEALAATGASPNGSGAVLSKFKHQGMVRRVGEGLWEPTPKGEAALRRIQKVEEINESASQ